MEIKEKLKVKRTKPKKREPKAPKVSNREKSLGKTSGIKKITIKKDNIGPGVFACAFVAAIVIYAVMLNAQKAALSDFATGQIYVAAEKIPEGQIITAENLGKYFTLKELDLDFIPAAAIKDAAQLEGLVPCYEIDKGTLITQGMFEDINTITANMEAPVIAGFKADDLYQVAGGVLRAGDRIHIFNVNAEGDAVLCWENVYVESVFDQTGQEISNSDKETSAQRINVYMDKSDMEAFYSELTSGSLRVVKAYN